jgi:hypothetical protein
MMNLHISHELKVLPKYFKPGASGDKPFEVRRNDRDYKVGQVILLREWTEDGGYTGYAFRRRITYILDDPEYVIPGYVILGLKSV